MPTPPTTAAKLGELLTYLRLNAKLSQQKLAASVKTAVKGIRDYEAGVTKPSKEILARLAIALNSTDLVAQVEALTAIDPALLAEPANVHLRLRHLFRQVAEDSQYKFTQLVGWPAASASPIVNQQTKLSAAKAAQIFARFPSLSEQWLWTGEGQPWPGEEPTLQDVASGVIIRSGKQPWDPLMKPKKGRAAGRVPARPKAPGKSPAAAGKPAHPIERAAKSKGEVKAAAHAEPQDNGLISWSFTMPAIQLQPRTTEAVVTVAPDVLVPKPAFTVENKVKRVILEPLVTFLRELRENNCGLTESQTADLHDFLTKY